MNGRLLWISIGGLLAAVLLGVSQPMTLRNDGIQFPDGTLQTTAVTAVGTPISSAPVVISEPGFYYFANNIEFGAAGANAIEVNAVGVTIDLMGFTLSNSDAADVGILITEVRAEVRNGAVTGFLDTGIKSSAFQARVLGVRLSDNLSGINLIGNGLVSTCTVVHNHLGISGTGITLGVGGIAIDNIVANFGTGIYIGGGGATVRGNHISLCGAGIDTQIDQPYIFNNNVQCSGCGGGEGVGIRVNTDARVSDNAVTFSTAKNIDVVGERNAIEHNLLTSSPVGIAFAADGSFYADNRASACTTPWDLGSTTQTDGGGNVAF